MLSAGDRACTAASAATLRSTLSGVPSAPELLDTSCESLWDLRLPGLLSRCRPFLVCVKLRSLPDDAARDSRCSVFWELMLWVRWLLLLLLRLRLLRPPSPSPSLLMLLQALWPREDEWVSASPSFAPNDLLPLRSFSSGLDLLYSRSRGGTREPGHCLVERNAERLV